MAPLTIEQLRNRFQLEAAPYWHLYDAKRSGTLITKYRDDDPSLTDEEKLEWSWEQLYEVLEMSPAGHAKVVLKTSPSANASKSSTYFVKWGQDHVGGRIGSTLPSTAATTEVKMMERMMAMMAESHKTQMDMMKDVLTERFQRQSLEEQIEGMGASSMGEQMLMGGLDIIKTMVATPRPQAALGTASAAGTVPPRPQQSEAGSPPPPAEEQPAGARPFSMDEAIHDISVMRRLMPEYHPNDVLKALAMFAAANPGQAKQYIGMLIQQIPVTDG